MTYKNFKLNKNTFNRRIKTTLQHKLRVVLKCYTIRKFELNEEERSFSFYKTYRVNGIMVKDKKQHFGRYEIEEFDENNIILKLIVDK